MVKTFRIVCIVSLIFIGSLDFSKSYALSNRDLETAEDEQNIDKRFDLMALLSGLEKETQLSSNTHNEMKEEDFTKGVEHLSTSLDTVVQIFTEFIIPSFLPQPNIPELFRAPAESSSLYDSTPPHLSENVKTETLKDEFGPEKDVATGKESLKTTENEKKVIEAVNPKASEEPSKVENETMKKSLKAGTLMDKLQTKLSFFDWFNQSVTFLNSLIRILSQLPQEPPFYESTQSPSDSMSPFSLVSVPPPEKFIQKLEHMLKEMGFRLKK